MVDKYELRDADEEDEVNEENDDNSYFYFLLNFLGLNIV